MYEVFLNGHQVTCKTPVALRDLINSGHGEDFREIWILRGKARMVALVNKASAFLMMLQFDGDTGYTSRNRAYSGPAYATMAFVLSNGQMDEYPESWVLPERDWTEALEVFAANGTRSEKIQWHEDS